VYGLIALLSLPPHLAPAAPWQEITDSFAEGMSEAEKMSNLKSAEAEDPPKLEQIQAKKEEK